MEENVNKSQKSEGLTKKELNAKIEDLYSRYSKYSQEKLNDILKEFNPDVIKRYEGLSKRKQMLKEQNLQDAGFEKVYHDMFKDESLLQYTFLKNYSENKIQIDNIVKLEEKVHNKANKSKEKFDSLNKIKAEVVEFQTELNKVNDKIRPIEQQIKEKQGLYNNFAERMPNELDNNSYMAACNSLKSEISNLQQQLNKLLLERKQIENKYNSIKQYTPEIIDTKISEAKKQLKSRRGLEKRLEGDWKQMAKGVKFDDINKGNGNHQYTANKEKNKKINDIQDEEKELIAEEKSKTKPLTQEEIKKIIEKSQEESKRSDIDLSEKIYQETKRSIDERYNNPLNMKQKNDVTNSEKIDDQIKDSQNEEVKGEYLTETKKQNAFTKLFSNIVNWFKNRFNKNKEKVNNNETVKDDTQNDIEKQESQKNIDEPQHINTFIEQLRKMTDPNLSYEQKYVDNRNITKQRNNSKNQEHDGRD